jgi:putative phosphoesterase
MRIAVLSDIHDNIWKLDIALKSVVPSDAIICCGDLCSPFIVSQLARGFEGPIHIVFGNNDADLFRITTKAREFPHVCLRGEYFEETFDGRRIAVTHFDNIARTIASGERHDAVFYGHNHIFEIRSFGKTLAVNPGSIMGCQFDMDSRPVAVDSSYAIYDTETGRAEGYIISSAGTIRKI